MLGHIVAPWILTFGFWMTFGGCVDQPVRDAPAANRILVGWDPLACGPPHRVVLELADDGGAKLSASAPCNAGALTIDADHGGTYRGRIYASELHEVPVELQVDRDDYDWWMGAPP